MRDGIRTHDGYFVRTDVPTSGLAESPIIRCMTPRRAASSRPPSRLYLHECPAQPIAWAQAVWSSAYAAAWQGGLPCSSCGSALSPTARVVLCRLFEYCCAGGPGCAGCWICSAASAMDANARSRISTVTASATSRPVRLRASQPDLDRHPVVGRHSMGALPTCLPPPARNRRCAGGLMAPSPPGQRQGACASQADPIEPAGCRPAWRTAGGALLGAMSEREDAPLPPGATVAARLCLEERAKATNDRIRCGWIFPRTPSTRQGLCPEVPATTRRGHPPRRTSCSPDLYGFEHRLLLGPAPLPGDARGWRWRAETGYAAGNERPFLA